MTQMPCKCALQQDSELTSVQEAILTGPGFKPSSSYSWPPTGTYAMKWKASSFSPADSFSSDRKGFGEAKLLWACLTPSALPIVMPAVAGQQLSVGSFTAGQAATWCK